MPESVVAFQPRLIWLEETVVAVRPPGVEGAIRSGFAAHEAGTRIRLDRTKPGSHLPNNLEIELFKFEFG